MLRGQFSNDKFNSLPVPLSLHYAYPVLCINEQSFSLKSMSSFSFQDNDTSSTKLLQILEEMQLRNWTMYTQVIFLP